MPFKFRRNGRHHIPRQKFRVTNCVVLYLNVRLRRFAIITAFKHEICGGKSLKYAA
jgi:hypothetical protein